MLDRTLPLMLDGYPYLTRLRQSAGRDTVPARLLGQRATVLVGSEATKFFYDPANFDRRGVVPPTVKHTLFGDAGVQLLDGPAHARRKSLFTTVLDRAGSAALATAVCEEWDAASDGWRGRQVVLFDEAATLLARAVHRWAGVPLPQEGAESAAADLVAMVDGFATLGPRYLRARMARTRQERRIARLAADIRNGRATPAAGSPLAVFLEHRDVTGELLGEHTVAVEVLNLLRPTVAIAWFVAYAAHALHYWPAERPLLLAGDRAEGQPGSQAAAAEAAGPTAAAGPAPAVAFAHEVRRFYPITPFLGARAVRDLFFDGVGIPADSLAILDVFGQDHCPTLWPDPWRFSSRRHLKQPPGRFDLIPQGGGDPLPGRRCPGEPATVQALAALASRLAALDADLPEQDLAVSRHRIPARVRSGVVLRVAGSDQPWVARRAVPPAATPSSAGIATSAARKGATPRRSDSSTEP